MIDINLIRTNPDKVRENIRKKFQDKKLPLVDEVLSLDAKRRAGVTEAFVDLFRRGLIYRGEKMLHYCPTLQSVVSDVEVDWQDISRRQKLPLPSGQSVEVGVIYDIKYPLVGHED